MKTIHIFRTWQIFLHVAAACGAMPLAALPTDLGGGGGPLPPTITNVELPPAIEGCGYECPLTIVGGTPPYTVSIEPGSEVPSGIDLEQDAAGNWSLTGVAAPGTTSPLFIYLFNFLVTDSAGVSGAVTTYFFDVYDNIVFSSTSLTLIEGTHYSPAAGLISASADGGILLAFGSPSGGFPAGMTLMPAALVGAPAPGTSAESPYTAHLTIHDVSWYANTLEKEITIHVLPPLSLTTTMAPACEEGVPYDFQFEVSGGTAPYTFSTGLLPPGLSLGADGVISGTPTCSAMEEWQIYTAPYFCGLWITDSSDPPASDYCPFLFEGIVGSILSIGTTSLPVAFEAAQYDAPLSALGVVAETVWHADGLPQGLSVARIGGVWKIVGTPVLGSVGSHQVTLALEEYDAFGSHEVSATFTLVVEGETFMADVQVLTNHLPAAQEGENYPLIILEAAGGSGSYSFDVAGLPDGLEMGAAAGGVGTHWIDGRPEAGSAGEYSVIITVEDATGSTLAASATLTLVVLPASNTSPSLSPDTANLSGALLAGGALAGCSVSGSDDGLMILALLALVGSVATLCIRARQTEG